MPKRYFFVLATFGLTILLYVDRICISVAKTEIQTDLALSDNQMGYVFSAFALGYALLQTPSGWLVDRYGARRVLATIVTLWSSFTGLTAVASGFVSMFVVRLLFGAGEAGAFPSIARAVYAWIPTSERGLVQGINFSGSRLGAAFSLPMMAILIDQLSWRGTFVALMIVGFVWAGLWYLYFRDEPSVSVSTIDQDRMPSRDEPPTTSDVLRESGNMRLMDVLKSRNLWLLCGQYFASNFAFFFCLTWLFPSLQKRFELSGWEASLYASGPLIAGAIGNWTSGYWMDQIYRRRGIVASRRLPAMVGFTLAAIGLVASVNAQSALASSIWFSLSIFGADMTLSPSWNACIDIGGRQSGLVSGTMNMAGNIGSFVTALAFPYLAQWTGSDEPFFYVAATLNAMAILSWKMIDPNRTMISERIAGNEST